MEWGRMQTTLGWKCSIPTNMYTTWWGQTTQQLKDSQFVPQLHLESSDPAKADSKTLSKEEKYVF